MPRRLRFRGEIAGAGSTSGVRVVVGRWVETPLGAFADAMVETAAGHRVLLAPHQDAADFIASTYTFDEVRVAPFTATVTTLAGAGTTWQVRSADLELDLTLGARTPLGSALRLVPRTLATSPAWCTVTDPVARLALRGVRTRGSAGGGRREYYAATDRRAVTGLTGSFDGVPLGALAPVDPPCRFGFSSTPRRPGVTAVVTTVTVPD
ncbi:hypothetical protein [Nocardioides ferulae]|uniref:hypothetical protein n=1 Tax=Nocardioides ferulae TaxID=2340821 RepID=UPI001F0C6415|nr:hypothetical protein [Nocardioides ferulae]